MHGGLPDTTQMEIVEEFALPACVIVKHANPCGVSVAADILTAYWNRNVAVEKVQRDIAAALKK